jgi:hypothetical protein
VRQRTERICDIIWSGVAATFLIAPLTCGYENLSLRLIRIFDALALKKK